MYRLWDECNVFSLVLSRWRSPGGLTIKYAPTPYFIAGSHFQTHRVGGRGRETCTWSAPSSWHVAADRGQLQKCEGSMRIYSTTFFKSLLQGCPHHGGCVIPVERIRRRDNAKGHRRRHRQFRHAGMPVEANSHAAVAATSSRDPLTICFGP